MKNSAKYILIFIPFLFACQPSEKEQPQNEITAQKNPSLIVVSKEQFEKNRMDFDTLSVTISPDGIRATGIIDVPPENRVSLSPLMGGYVTYNPFLVGDHVQKGQLLLRLENPEFVTLQQEYLEIREQLKYLREEYTRHKELLEEQITSRKNFLRAESEYRSANATYFGLRKRLQLLDLDPDRVTPENITSQISIYAPISGSITKIHVTKGSFANPSSPALEIINGDHLHLEINVFEKDVMKVKRGQKISFQVPEAAKETFPAEVHLISEALSDQRTIRVHGHIPDSLKNNFVVGMYVEAMIQNNPFKEDKPTDLSAASAAVVEKEGRYFILILEKDESDAYTFRQVAVSAGAEIEGRRILRSPDLSVNSVVLKKGAFDLVR
ncbi:efflux RND transporter periplasmic adaptor subunit [Robertkochia flava]|uniref:efflux RND transporter periplasmic adaptor subunit n=1 Tax=Robertkochia flava TaxID=3447986 RepID=UPI001CCD48D1|nr:efflux RND transporter periplasmic adaptor subunit [Robertkochia marina]